MDKPLKRTSLRRSNSTAKVRDHRAEAKISLPKSYEDIFKQSLDRRGRPVTAADMLDA